MSGSSNSIRAALLDAALRYAAAGLRPVPMCLAQKRPALRGWQAKATTDEGGVRAAFVEARHADGIAIATGGGVLVLDLDRNHGDGADGIVSLGELARRHDTAFPGDGPRVRTPRGGLHSYLRTPAIPIRNRVGLAPGVDVRGDGGLAIVPPSRAACGDYRWVGEPDLAHIPLAPDCVLALAARSEPASAPMPRSVGSISRYVQAAVNNEIANVRRAPSGTRNHTLFKASARLGSLVAAGALDHDQVAVALFEAACVCGLVQDDGPAVVRATIASGLRHGFARPRVLPSQVHDGK